MKRPLSLCAVSGGRADYGLLVSPLRAIRADPAFHLRLVVTGQHLVASAGDTAAQVRQDGFDVAAEIDMQIEGDDPSSVIRSAARALAGMVEPLTTAPPDLLLLLGDRYEIICCALAATIARVPIAHIAGGDLTEGAFDDTFRHAITKMAHLHFVTNKDAAHRVRQLGEPTDRIHVVGSPGLDLIHATTLAGRDEFFSALGLSSGRVNFLVTFHPVTLARDSVTQVAEMLAALDTIPDATILFTGSNADPEGRQIETYIRDFVSKRPRTHFIPSLGTRNYFSALAHMDAVVGNSSSGLYEAPSFGIPTVNIGDRQKGRLKALSVFDCAPRREAISAAIDAALARGRCPTDNPYGDGHASEKILAVLKSIDDPQALLRKPFTDMPLI